MESNELTIFIVDDVQDNAVVLVNIFEPLGYRTMVALDGKTALSLIEEYKPDIILLDIMMPEMDGYQVCTALKANPATKDIPVIFLSALTDTVNKVKGLEIGGVDYISKPFEEAEVISRIKVRVENSILQKELKMLNDKKNKFFSIIAHDLRRPLGTIINSTKLLEDFVTSKDMKSIQEATKNLGEVTNNTMAFLRNLLEWSRIQIGTIKVNRTRLNVNGIISKSLESFKKEITHKNLDIVNEIPNDSYVYGDRYMVTTVLENLVSNAVKFSNWGGHLTFTEKVEGDTAIISLIDTGVGIQKDKIPYIFEIDKNIRSSGTAGEVGTGLGLILSRDFIEKLNGKIWLEQNLPKGTKVSFTLSTKG
jgi:two-component system, sensor histidine kinase and response regulator